MKNLEKSKLGLRKTIGIIVAILITIGIAFVCVVYAITYHSQVEPAEYVQVYDDVELSYVGRNMYFDGPGEDTLFIFYQGALVETESYTPLLARLARSGVDCIAIHAPLNLAALSNYRFDSIIKAERFADYKYHYVGGHAQGGFYVTDYAFEKSNEIDGLILLASYGVKDYRNSDLPVLSIYGSNDKVLDMENYTISEFFMPDDFTSVCISGGNHSYFGFYGEQSGDGDATIAPKEQWNSTVSEINKFINRE